MMLPETKIKALEQRKVRAIKKADNKAATLKEKGYTLETGEFKAISAKLNMRDYELYYSYILKCKEIEEIEAELERLRKQVAK